MLSNPASIAIRRAAIVGIPSLAVLFLWIWAASRTGCSPDQVPAGTPTGEPGQKIGYYDLPLVGKVQFVMQEAPKPPGNVDHANVIKLLKEKALEEGWDDASYYPTLPPSLKIKKYFSAGSTVQPFRLPTSNMHYRVRMTIEAKFGRVLTPPPFGVTMFDMVEKGKKIHYYTWNKGEFLLRSDDVPVTGATFSFTMPVDAEVHASIE